MLESVTHALGQSLSRRTFGSLQRQYATSSGAIAVAQTLIRHYATPKIECQGTRSRGKEVVQPEVRFKHQGHLGQLDRIGPSCWVQSDRS
jgi:hypothetical protein